MTRSNDNKQGPNPSGLCQCGCGQLAPIAKRTFTWKGVYRGQPQRFLPHHRPRFDGPDYIIDPETGCWNWQRGMSGGYGITFVQGRMQKAHRVYWEDANGPIPDGLYVCHHCDNRRCVNPDHMFLGTHLDNMRDRDTKGRNVVRYGEAHHSAKLTWALVHEMRSRFAAGEPRKAIHRDFAFISYEQLCKVLRGVSWSE